ncbi:hypothetical protein GNI_165080 [Gregarina niphandrodes]|uniref:Uncharacterized protein n=1 Tax=Gregarina niphandrodes TaxID=110365 RepID=A0A023AY67_GRENI|nr:hypothetical protein GNI_165080 [Gregarina niphandrodes]EZG43602.1 hypothetical protein GNI_165080 [Gregarina niphandrodes]|eukprot:XP_011133168.1 hypothetical protein GNI_165080 [Gregarina niphandrodes]
MVAINVERDVSTCYTEMLSHSAEPMNFPETCARPEGGAFICDVWEPRRTVRRCFKYGDDVGATFEEVQDAISVPYTYCSLNHMCIDKRMEFYQHLCKHWQC